jgi:hypothetical protein
VNPDVYDQYVRLSRECSPQCAGRLSDAREIERLIAMHPGVPRWYVEVLLSVPVAGMEMSRWTNHGKYVLHMLSVDDILSELEVYPMCVAGPAGYTPIAMENGGSDPFGIARSKDDPEVVCIHHDGPGILNDMLTPEDMECVASSLSQWLREYSGRME